MNRNLCFGILLLTTAVGLLGCSVTSPPGYEALSQHEPTYISPTPWKMYGYAPLSWDHPDGRTIVLDVQEAWVATGPVNIYTSRFEFDIQYAGNDGLRLHCRTDPSGPGVPQTHFGCWSDDGTELWMAPDLGCGIEGWEYWDTGATPECWTGVAQTGHGEYGLQYGYLESTGLRAPELTWNDPTGNPVLAAEMGPNIALYQGSTTDPEEDLLVLLTVALKFYTQASSDG